MTHSVNGHIIQDRLLDYDRELTNSLVAEFSRKFGDYIAKHSKHYGTTYSRSDRSQPFIHVLDTPTLLSEYKLNITNLPNKDFSIFISVESGSHVGIKDTRLAEEIYDTTINLSRVLSKKLSRKFDVLFDNQHQLYLPSEFQRSITLAA